MSKGEDAEREASRWIARLEAHDVSLRDHRRFRAWLAQSPANRTAYDALARTWDKLDALAFLAQPVAPPEHNRSRRWLILGSGSAVLAAGLSAGIVLLPGVEDANAIPYLTRVGERRLVRFTDGSTAELNADTHMRVAIASRERRIHLEQGEALFDVSPDNARPFIVATGFGELHARGAAFLVKIGPDSTRATVIRGVVEGVRNAGPLAVFASPETATATASQEISLQTSVIESSALPVQTLARRLAWRDGMLAFDGETLREATLEIERQTGVHFEFAEASIGDLRVGGYIRATDVNAFLDLVEANLALHAERHANSVTLSR